MRKLIKYIEDDAKLDRIGEPTAGAVGKLTRATPIKNALSGTWLGHSLHPILSDLPIGAWGSALFVDLTAGERGADAARKLVGAGILAVAPTAASGASDWSESYGPEQRVGLVHAVTNSAGTLLQVASWIARKRGKRGAGIALSALGFGVTSAASYLGGHLTLVRGVGVNHTAFEHPEEKWIEVAVKANLDEKKPYRVDAGGVPVMLVEHLGTVYALSAECTHAGGPLDEGELVGADCIRCPWHASEFRLTDGSVVRGPASVAQPAWDVKVENDKISVRPKP